MGQRNADTRVMAEVECGVVQEWPVSLRPAVALICASSQQ